MSFKSQFSACLDRIPGALGILLADGEGEMVDQAARMDDYELRVVGAHLSIVLQNIKDSSLRLGDEAPREIAIMTTRLRILVLPVSPEYFLVLVLDRTNPSPRAFFEAHRCRDVLRQEIG